MKERRRKKKEAKVAKLFNGGIQCKFIQTFCHTFGLSHVSLYSPLMYIFQSTYVRYVLMMLDALCVLILWCVCMCSMLVCFTNYDKSLHLILVQPIPISPGWLKESLVPSFHQKNFCNKIGCTFLIQGVPGKSGLIYLNSSLLLLSRQMFRKSKLNEYKDTKG